MSDAQTAQPAEPKRPDVEEMTDSEKLSEILVTMRAVADGIAQFQNMGMSGIIKGMTAMMKGKG